MAKVTAGSKGSKGSRPGSLAGPARRSLKVSLDPETVRVLKVECLGRECTYGALLDELVRSMPRGYILSARAKGLVGTEGQPDPAGQRPQEAPRGLGTIGLHRDEVA